MDPSTAHASDDLHGEIILKLHHTCRSWPSRVNPLCLKMPRCCSWQSLTLMFYGHCENVIMCTPPVLLNIAIFDVFLFFTPLHLSAVEVAAKQRNIQIVCCSRHGIASTSVMLHYGGVGRWKKNKFSRNLYLAGSPSVYGGHCSFCASSFEKSLSMSFSREVINLDLVLSVSDGYFVLPTCSTDRFIYLFYQVVKNFFPLLRVLVRWKG